MNKKPRNKMKIAAYIAGMLLFAAYLLYSNQLFVALNQTMSKIEKISWDEWHELLAGVSDDSEVFWTMYQYNVNNDDMLDMTMHGFAGCKTDEDNRDRYVNVILLGQNNVYRVSTTLEVAVNNGVFKEKNLKGSMNNFITTFPTLAINQDIYQVGLYVWENEQTAGYIDLGIAFEMASDGLREYTPKVAVVEANDNATVYVNGFRQNLQAVNGGDYILNGMAIKANVDSKDSKVYLKLIFEDGAEKCYSTLLKPGEYYNGVFNTDIYRRCQFVARIPQKELKGQTVQIQVLVDNDGVAAYSQDYFIFKFNDTGYEEVATAEALIDFSPTVDSSLLVTNSTWIDTQNADNGFYSIKGNAWIYDHPIAEPEMYIYLKQMDGTYIGYETLVSQSDWAKGYLGEEYQMASYSAKMATEQLPADSFGMYLLIKEDDRYYSTVEPVWIDWKEGRLEIRQEVIQTESVSHFEPTIDTTRRVMNSVWIDAQDTLNNYCSIKGTAWIYQHPMEDPEMYICIIQEDGTELVYETQVTRSEWTASNLGEEYRMAGYSAKIAFEGLPKEDFEMRLLIKENDTYYSTATTTRFLWEDGQLTIPEPEKEVVELIAPVDFDPAIDASLAVTNSTWIEAADIAHGIYTIKGNAWINGHPVSDPEMYLKLCRADGEVVVYPAQVGPSNWAMDYLGEEYQMASYAVRIETDSLGGEDFELQVLLKENDTVYSTVSATHFIWSDGQLIIREPGGDAVQTASPVDFDPEIDESLAVTNSTWIEAADIAHGIYTIKGNAWINGHPVTAPEMYLKLHFQDGTAVVYPAEVMPSDWAIGYLGEEYQMAGYTVRLAAGDLAEKDFKLQVLLKEGDTVYSTDTMTGFTWENGELTIV